MTSKQPIDATTALDNLFQVIREEALSNPRFARRLLETTGHVVQFRGDEALSAVDPVLVAMQGATEFRATFMSMKAADIKKIAKAANLLQPGEKLPAATGALTDLLWDRASERLRDLFPQVRHAAE